MDLEEPGAAGTLARLREENAELRAHLRDLRARLDEPADIVRAIRDGEVDAFVVSEPRGERIYSLRRADVLYRVMVEEMKEGAATVDESGTIAYCNSYFAELLGQDRRAMVGSSLWPFVPEESRPFFEAWGGQATARLELMMRATHGELVPVVCTVNRLDAGEEAGLFCVIMTDLRKQRREEQLVAESRRKDEFLAMLAHELRNPIAPLRTAGELLRSGGTSGSRVEKAGQVIERQVAHMSRLIDDLLDVSRITRGKIRLELEPVDLSVVVERSVEMSRPLVDARRHQLTVVPPQGPLRVQADVTRLSQAISNLLDNASKFTPEGGRIWITLQARDGVAVIKVRDTGVGIAPDMMSRIFELFAQGDRTQETAKGGLGIGLTLVRTLIEMHQGTVEASSPGPGQGSELVVKLPLLVAPAVAAPAAAPAGNAAAAEPGPRRKVLVVDDNVDAAELLVLHLEDHGHEARVALTGEAALAAVDEFQPDVMLIDIDLPGMSGHELARRLRARPGARPVLVAVTGFGKDRDRAASRDAGFDQHWVKPIGAPALMAFLAALSPPR
jgi:PAS domain S-box-containing protein